jgi:hypothetical protein
MPAAAGTGPWSPRTASSQIRATPDEQNNLIGIPRPVIAEEWWSVQIGGSARGYFTDFASLAAR